MKHFLLLVALLATSIVLDRNGALSVGALSCEAKSSPLVSNGLKNCGNTCYMNAQLQSAFHIPALRDIATSISPSQPILAVDGDDEETSGDLEETTGDQEEETTEAALAFKEVVDGMIEATNSNFMAYMPRSFCMRLGIPPMVQQDSQEFWKLLLPAVGVEKLSSLYKGKFEGYISAIDGSGREKRRSEVFLDLSLDIKESSTLLDSLKEQFGEPELLNAAEGNGWRPEKGADQVNAHKGSSLLAKGLPPILQFHLKRFEYDWNTDTTTKLNNRFTFPQSMDLASLCIDVEESDPQCQFELQAVIMHVGEYNMGHYYAYVRPDIEKDEWYRFNDDKVDQVTFDDVITDAYGGKKIYNKRGVHRRIGRLFRNKNKFGWGGETSNAYVVQYVQRSNIESLYPAE